MKKRLIIFFTINISLLVSALFLVWFGQTIAETPLASLTECPSIKLFGIFCPFCGGTRAIGALLSFKPVCALIYNPAVTLSVVAYVYYCVTAFVAIVKNKEKVLKLDKWVLFTLLAILILNFLARNALHLFWDFMHLPRE